MSSVQPLLNAGHGPRQQPPGFRTGIAPATRASATQPIRRPSTSDALKPATTATPSPQRAGGHGRRSSHGSLTLCSFRRGSSFAASRSRPASGAVRAPPAALHPRSRDQYEEVISTVHAT